jgi:hypothetical protein
MFKYKMTFPRAILFSFVSLNLLVYLFKNISEVNIFKLTTSILIIGMMTYGISTYVIKEIRKKKI